MLPEAGDVRVIDDEGEKGELVRKLEKLSFADFL
jgi:hypothetical protein